MSKPLNDWAAKKASELTSIRITGPRNREIARALRAAERRGRREQRRETPGLYRTVRP
jgi:hypothetical protein